LSGLSQTKGIERNLLVKNFTKQILYSKENIKITLFYSENSKKFKNLDGGKTTALLSQGSLKFLETEEESELSSNKNKFVSEDVGSRTKRFQTIPIILPNTIHTCKKRNL